MSPAATLRERRREAEESADPETVLKALNDVDCRAILAAVEDGPATAKELAEACDLPLSTAYRKLELLTEAGLLQEGTRIGTGHRHPSQYERDFAGLRIDVTAEGDLDVEPVADGGGDERHERAPGEALLTGNAD
jgi:DNA-binding transcriptional ArsR family regulator